MVMTAAYSGTALSYIAYFTIPTAVAVIAAGGWPLIVAQRLARDNRSEVELCRVDTQCRRNFVAAGFA